MEIMYEKEIRSKFLSWLPKQLLRLDLRPKRFWSSLPNHILEFGLRSYTESQEDPKATTTTTPMFSQLPPLLEVLRLGSTFGLVAEDFKHLPKSITGLHLKMTSNVEGFEKYLGSNIKYWEPAPEMRYKYRLFEEFYSLPSKV